MILFNLENNLGMSAYLKQYWIFLHLVQYSPIGQFLYRPVFGCGRRMYTTKSRFLQVSHNLVFSIFPISDEVFSKLNIFLIGLSKNEMQTRVLNKSDSEHLFRINPLLGDDIYETTHQTISVAYSIFCTLFYHNWGRGIFI